MRLNTLFTLLIMTTSISNLRAQNPDYLFMVEQAIKAPSGHNAQPWLFNIQEDYIEIRPDYDRALPVVDPDNRELFVSLGCAVENLCLAASVKHYTTAVEITETGTIRIGLTQTETTADSTLFHQIPLRQTNRSIYNGKKVPGEDIQVLANLSDNPSIKIHCFENGSPGFEIIRQCIVDGNTVQMHDKAFRKELLDWMRFNKKHSEKTHDGLSYSVFGAPNLPGIISKPAISMAINEKSQNKGDNKKISSGSHFVLFTSANNTIQEWVTLGRILQRFILQTTHMGIAHSYYNQPNEIPVLSSRMSEELQLTQETPVVLLRIGYGDPMPYSKRRDIQEVLLAD